MCTGEVEANLKDLNDGFKLSYVSELISRKMAGAERSSVADADMAMKENSGACEANLNKRARILSYLRLLQASRR
jgi:hypothetical protein